MVKKRPLSDATRKSPESTVPFRALTRPKRVFPKNYPQKAIKSYFHEPVRHCELCCEEYKEKIRICERYGLDADHWNYQLKRASEQKEIEENNRNVNIFEDNNREERQTMFSDLHSLPRKESELKVKEELFYYSGVEVIDRIEFIAGYGRHSDHGYSITKDMVNDILAWEKIPPQPVMIPGTEIVNQGRVGLQCQQRRNFDFLRYCRKGSNIH